MTGRPATAPAPSLARSMGCSGSRESLFDCMITVANTEPEVIARCVQAQEDKHRDEMKRILGHLPVIREHLHRKHGHHHHHHHEHAHEEPANAQDLLGSGGPIRAVHHATFGGTRYGAADAGGSPLPGALSTPRGAAPRTGTPRAGTPRVGTPRAATPRAGARLDAAPSAAATPRVAGGTQATPRGATPWATRPMTPYEGAPPVTAGSSGSSSTVSSRHYEAKLNPYQERLAALGIDTEGRKATEILRLFYARGDCTTYRAMNQEVYGSEKQRPTTPLCLRKVLTSRAYQEVRSARDMPTKMVHDCLDKWEIETMADMCRSIRYYEEEAQGPVSEYTRGYTKTVFGQIGRKKYVRKPV